MIGAKDVFHQLTSGPGIMDNVCNFIIRPPRSDYEIEDLGPEVFRIGDDGKQRFMRHDFELENMRGLSFQCSWFKAYPAQRAPCVVYCHGNCGSRYDALEALFVLREGMSLFCFDFCGSGMSDGEYISLGFYERQDLAAVMEFLTLKSDEVDGVALWGRSMGAVTSIMYAAKDPSIRCIVCDSPFATLRVLINDLVERHGGWTARVVPNAVVRAIVERIRNRIMKRAAFDIDDLDTVKYARLCRAPALLFYGSEDDFVTSRHCDLIRDAFATPCLQQYTPGGHNDERDEEIKKVIGAFLHLYLIDKPTGVREQEEQARQKATTATATASPPPPPVTRPSASPKVTPCDTVSVDQPRWSYSASPMADDVSATSSELRHRFCSLQATPSIPELDAVQSTGGHPAQKMGAEVPVSPRNVVAPSPVVVRTAEKPTTCLPNCGVNAANSVAGTLPSNSNSNSATVVKSSDGTAGVRASLPQLLPSSQQRPTPLFSATERKAPTKSPLMDSGNNNRGVTRSPGRMPNITK